MEEFGIWGKVSSMKKKIFYQHVWPLWLFIFLQNKGVPVVSECTEAD